MKKTLIATSLLASMAAFNASASGILIEEWGYINELGFDDWENEQGTDAGITASGAVNPELQEITTLETYTSLAWGDRRGANANELNGLVNDPDDDNDAYDQLLDELGFTSGELNPQSSLVINSPVTGVDGVVTNSGEYSLGTSVTHNNWVVGGSETLDSATLLDLLILKPVIPAMDIELLAPIIDFSIDFIETSNRLQNASRDRDGFYSNYELDTTRTCLDGELNGTGLNSRGCADVLLLTTNTPGVNFSLELDDSNIPTGNLLFATTFNFGVEGLDAYDYTVTTRLSGLQLVDAQTCSRVAGQADCLGFFTEENQSNTLTAEYKIDATLVPEPTTIALFGLSVLGLAGAARRRAV